MLICVPAAAVLLTVHEETIRRSIRTGQLKVYKTKGGQRVDTADLGLPPAHVKAMEAEFTKQLALAAERQIAMERLCR